MTKDLATTSSSSMEIICSYLDIRYHLIRSETESKLAIKSGIRISLASLQMSIFTLSSGEMATTSRMMKCWEDEVDGTTNIRTTFSYSGDGGRVSKSLYSSHNLSSVQTDTAALHTKTRKAQESSLLDVALGLSQKSKSRRRLLVNGMPQNSNLDSNLYTRTGSDIQIMSELLSQHFSTTSDIIALRLSRLCGLEMLN